MPVLPARCVVRDEARGDAANPVALLLHFTGEIADALVALVDASDDRKLDDD